MTPWDTCRVCPRLCRDACPVATGSGREAAVPMWIATTLHAWEHQGGSKEDAAAAATLCTDCGGCRDHCHLHRPLPELLRAARGRLLPEPPMEPLGPVEGGEHLVVIETDDRPLHRVLRDRGHEVAVLRTGDALGVAAIEHPGFERRAAELRDRLAGRQAVVVDGDVARALGAARVPFRWAWELVGEAAGGVASCATGGDRPLACCGGAGPLPRHHPEDAARVARLFVERGEVSSVADGCCRAHLRRAGAAVTDWLDRALLELG